MPLTTRESFLAPAPSNASKSVGQMSLERVADMMRPMPPTGLVAATERTTFTDWVSAGMLAGSCAGGVDGGAPVQRGICTSNRMFAGDKGPTMNPGRACIACHTADEGPSLVAAGTVYPTLGERDMCYGVDGTKAAVQVVLTDSTGKDFTAAVNATGNFLFDDRTFVKPITKARVTTEGRTRAMGKAPPRGDCNSCHTQDGAEGSPGRIWLP
jgi:mono/diheme cytochrome c family protein